MKAQSDEWALATCSSNRKPALAERQADDLNVGILYDNDRSERYARKVMRRVGEASGADPASLRIHEFSMSPALNDPERGIPHLDLLLVAVQTDHHLPDFVKAWLKRWINFRPEGQEGALVALVTDRGVVPDANSPLVAHLETLAVIGRLAFFHGSAGHGPSPCRMESRTSTKS